MKRQSFLFVCAAIVATRALGGQAFAQSSAIAESAAKASPELVSYDPLFDTLVSTR